MKIQVVESYTEKDYSMEELIKKMAELMFTARKNNLSIEFVTQKPKVDENGNQIYDGNGYPCITTDFPAELNVYRLIE